MPWIEAVLRGQKVFARIDDAGKLLAEGGRVEIRYKQHDGKAYRASAGNLEIAAGATRFADDHCGEADAAPAAGAKKGASDKDKKAAAAAKVRPPSADELTVYADGACSGNPGPAGAGFVVVLPGGKMLEGFEYLGTATNNIAELTAILRAVEAIADRDAKVRVHTDSSYSIGVLQKGWKAKANPELIAKIRTELASRRGVVLVYVPGHAGVPLNERADQLARQAVATRSSRALPVIESQGT